MWEFGSTEVTEAFYAFEVCWDHESWYDGAFDAGVSTACDECEVVIVIEKELGGDEGGACVDFLFEVCYVGFEVACFRVFFGIATDSDFEVWALCLDELNEFIGVVKTFWVWGEVLVSFGWVSA